MIDDARLGPKLWAFAIALGATLAALWTWSNWTDLSHLQLPDTDDMARLQQVRDWLAGQRFGDLVQHRLGDGVTGSLHWSRLADLGIAAWMVALRPILGERGDLWAAILWPATLYILFLGQSARLALRLAGRAAAGPAIIIAALAFPAISMFVPGRIDHHGLQIVLTLLLVDAVLHPPSARSGMMAGLLAALSLAIGLETAPQVACAMAAIGLFGLGIRRRASAITGIRRDARGGDAGVARRGKPLDLVTALVRRIYACLVRRDFDCGGIVRRAGTDIGLDGGGSWTLA